MACALCDETNIGSSLKFLSSELEILGYPEIDYENENDKKALVQLVNITVALISEHRRLAVKENERTVELLKLNSQISSHNQEKNRLERLLNKEKNAVSVAKESLTSALELKKKVEKELSQSKKIIKNLKKESEILNLRHGKEILFKENIIANLKAKLVTFINFGTDVEESLALPQLSDLTINQPKVEKYICSLNNNIQFLILENANIRNLIMKIFVEFSNKADAVNNVEEEVMEYLLNLPGEDFIGKLENKLHEIMKQFKIVR